MSARHTLRRPCEPVRVEFRPVLIDLEPRLSRTVKRRGRRGRLGHVHEERAGVADLGFHGEADSRAGGNAEGAGVVAGGGVDVAADVEGVDVGDGAVRVGACPLANVLPVGCCLAVFDQGGEDVWEGQLDGLVCIWCRQGVQCA